MAIINGTHKADTIIGTAQDDSIFGDNGNDTINGGAGNDTIDGGNGSDLISGGAGNDVIDGGNGQDTIVYAGNRADYRVMQGLNGAVIVRDLRSGRPDGEDRLFSAERIQFADGTFKLVDLIEANAAPVARNDALTLSETAGKTEVTPTLLANDSDPDGDSLVVSSVQAVSAQGAIVTLGPDGKVSYDAGSIFADLDNGQTATDSFTYTITDGNGHVSTATATVTITGVTQNEAPVAGNDQLTLAEDAGATDVTAQLLANDSDPDGDAFKVTEVQAVSAKGAAVTVDKDGVVNYDAGKIFVYLEEGQTATDTFTYTITDSAGLTSTATATVTITGVTPEVEMPEWDTWFYVSEDGTNDEMWGWIVESFGFDIAGVDASHALGTVEFNYEQGLLSFTADHPSSDVLNYDQHQDTWFTVIGDNGKKITVGMVIEGVNDAIVAVDDQVAVGEGQTTGNLYSTLVSNEIDPDGGANSNRILSVDTTGTQGSVSFDASGRTVIYSAAGLDLAPGETLVDSFTYLVEDGFHSTDTATVFVTVTGAADGSVSASMSDSLMAAFLPAGGSGGHDLPTFDMAQAQMILGADAYIA
ncbi:MAG TPA: Ig-like domain-containing protein [Allosphingosinicella sp.]